MIEDPKKDDRVRYCGNSVNPLYRPGPGTIVKVAPSRLLVKWDNPLFNSKGKPQGYGAANLERIA